MKLVNQGKTCDIYKCEEYPELMFFNRTDRFSVGDKVFPGHVMYKGLILNQMSIKWMDLLEKNKIIDNHLIATEATGLLELGVSQDFSGSIVAAMECIPIPLECIVRGYYIPESKSWNPYKIDCNMYGNILPEGLKESQKLPEPIYTPSTKAAVGDHDINITYEDTIDVLEKFLDENFELNEDEENFHELACTLAQAIKKASLKAYSFAHEYALSKGIILADTKLEFGLYPDFDEDGNEDWPLVLIDEVFTPDSSRFWDASSYEVGKPQPSMDKQYLRRHVYQELKWDGQSEPPEIDSEVKRNLSKIYCNIFSKLFEKDIITLTEEIAWDWNEAMDSALEAEEEKNIQKQAEKEISHHFDS